MSDTQMTVGTPGEVQTMHPMVSVALGSRELTTETIRELMTLQREWDEKRAEKAFTRAMVALKAQLPSVLERDKTVDFTSQRGRTHYTHTSLAAAVEAVTPILTEHYFSATWTPDTTKGEVRVTCSLTHVDGHTKSASISAPADNSGNKSPAQAVASTITLLQRYTLLSLLGIATRDHVDPEPQQRAAPVVDSKTNLKAAAWIVSQGYSQEDVAKVTDGREVREWTADDIAAIKRAFATKKAPEREPGEEG